MRHIPLIMVSVLLAACPNDYRFTPKYEVPVTDPDALPTDTEVPVDVVDDPDTDSDPNPVIDSDSPTTDAPPDEEIDPEDPPDEDSDPIPPIDTDAIPPTPDSDPPAVDSDPLPVDSDVAPVDSDPLPIDSDPPIDTDIIPPLESYYPLDYELLWPESGSWDETSQAFFVGSLSEGYVKRIGVGGVETIWYEHPQAQSGWQTWGVEADQDRRRLFVCARKGSQFGAPWAIWMLDLDTAAMLREVPMTDTGRNAQCRDFTIVPHTGKVFVTDRGLDMVHRLDPDTGDLQIWSEDARLGTGVWGPDGIAYSAEANAILVAKSKPPALFRIPLFDPLNVHEVSIDILSWRLQAGHGLDALEFWQGDLWVAGVNRIIQVIPDDPAQWNSAEAIAWLPPIDGVSGLTRASDGRLFTVNGDPFAYTLSTAPDLPFEIVEVVTPLTLAP